MTGADATVSARARQLSAGPRWLVPLLIALLASSYGCGEAGTKDRNGSRAATRTEPGWVIQQTPKSTLAVVYVHGIFGDILGTWTNASGGRFFDLLESRDDVKGKADTYAFGFPSTLFGSGSFDIREAANSLHLRLEDSGIVDYPTIVFVGHSMGGLVVLRELLTHPEVRERVPAVVLFATPQEGSDVTRIAKHVADNPALSQMTPADTNDLLKTLSDEWNSIPAQVRPHVRCAYEKLPTFGVMIVPWSSATRFCEDAPPAINANHIDIVKPAGAGSDSIVVVSNTLKQYVFDRRLETPDFAREGDDWAIQLASAVGTQRARLVNAGRATLRFSFAEVSDPLLYLLPWDTPRQLPGNTSTDMGILLGYRDGPLPSEFRFVLRTDAAPDLRVVVRVPDPAGLQRQQAQLVADVAGSIEAMLAGPEGDRLRASAANNSEAAATLAQAARVAVARTSPDLPEGAQWVLTAEALKTINWPGLAVVALREAERASPMATHVPGVRQLAAVAGAQSGEPEVFRTAATPALSSTELQQLQYRNLLVAAEQDQAMRLAGELERVPALKSLGLSLAGDVHEAAGDADAARRSLQEAARIRQTPSLRHRLEAVNVERPTDDSPADARTRPVVPEERRQPAVDERATVREQPPVSAGSAAARERSRVEP